MVPLLRRSSCGRVVVPQDSAESLTAVDLEARLRRCWVPVDELVESDLVLPEPDITLEEAEELFTGEGILPG